MNNIISYATITYGHYTAHLRSVGPAMSTMPCLWVCVGVCGCLCVFGCVCVCLISLYYNACRATHIYLCFFKNFKLVCVSCRCRGPLGWQRVCVWGGGGGGGAGNEHFPYIATCIYHTLAPTTTLTTHITTCIYTYTHTNTYTDWQRTLSLTPIRIYIHTYIHTNIQIYVYTYYINTYIRIYKHQYIHSNIQKYVYTCILIT
jgi:hypothetical protein